MSENPIIEAGPVAEAMDAITAPYREALRSATGRLELFDAHTHIGSNDPDGHRQSAGELVAALERAEARGVVFPMHEPAGYGPANDHVLEAAAESDDRLVAFCRVNPHLDAVAEAWRCIEAGARGIKLHPRAEGFTLAEPAVRELVAMAAERRLPILVHAGRGIPALGRDAVDLCGEFPEARLILAHAAVSDLAWIWREVPSHPNLFIDTAWWTPGDMIALFSLVPSSQILWASDSPYASPVASAAQHLRYALQAGVEPDALRLIAGAQLERLLAGDDPLPAPRPLGETQPLAPQLERVVDHLMTAVGRCTGLADPEESIALARLACAVEEGPHTATCAAVLDLLDLAEEHLPPPEGVQWSVGAQIIVFAIAVARTPAAPLPSLNEAPAPTREEAEARTAEDPATPV